MEPPFNQLTTTTTQKQVTVLGRTFANTQPGDIVFDGFAGTGMTGVAAGMCGNPEKNYLDTSAVNLGSSEISDYVPDYKNEKEIQESITLTPNLDTSKHSRQDKMAFCQRYLHLGGVAGSTVKLAFRRNRLRK